jgi:hypothetical protein
MPLRWGEADTLRVMHSRLWRQLEKRFPRADATTIARMLEDVFHVRVASADGVTWSYAYTDGRCCLVSDVTGTARVRADGTIEVGAPTTTGSRTMPC